MFDAFRLRQLALALESANCFGVRAQLVGRDVMRRPVAHRRQHLTRKAIRPARIAAVQQREIYQPAVFIDSPEQVLPLAADPDIGLVHAQEPER